MCGHVGIAGDLEHRDEGTLKRLLLYDFFRGPDSTGLAAVRKSGEVKIAKVASHPLDLFEMKRFVEALACHTSSVFMGHNRAATKGKVNGPNAHPYEYGDVVGCHNGTLTAASWFALEEKIGHKTDVDSQALIECISLFGIQDTVSLLDGAWALVWYDGKDKTLNFLRNKERTFWVAFDKDFTKVFWASEWPMIQAATKLSPHVYNLFVDDNGYSYFSTDVDVLYTYDVSTMKSLLLDKRKDIETRTEGLTGKEPAPVVTTYKGNSPFMVPTMGSPKTNSTTTPSVVGKTSSTVNQVVHLKGSPTDPFAGILDQDKFDEIASFGCSFCSAEMDYYTPGATIFMKDDIILCGDCCVDPSTNRILLEDITALLA